MVVMPRGEGRFVGGGEGIEFEAGVPLYFVVKMRVREGGRGEVVTEGRWEKVFNVVEGGDSGLVIEENQWMCEGGAVGYLVNFDNFFSYSILLSF